jgi:hypothetical protein
MYGRRWVERRVENPAAIKKKFGAAADSQFNSDIPCQKFLPITERAGSAFFLAL